MSLTDADRRWIWNTLDSGFRHWVTRLERFIFVATQAEIDAITTEIRALDASVDKIDDWIDAHDDPDNDIDLSDLKSAVEELRTGVGSAIGKVDAVPTADNGGVVGPVDENAPHVVNPAVEDPSLPTPAPAGAGPVAEAAIDVVPDPITPGADDRADDRAGFGDDEPVNNVPSDPTIVN